MKLKEISVALILLICSGSLKAEPLLLKDHWALDEKNIKATLKLSAEYQLREYGEELPVKSWLVGTFFSGMLQAYNATGDRWYLKQTRHWADVSNWDINNAANADDLCPAQTYLDLLSISKNTKHLAALNEKIEPLLHKKVFAPLELNEYQTQKLVATGRNLWSWADALYMAPPVYARLGKATGNDEYFTQLHKLYWDAVEHLYDPKEHLFYRDARYLPSAEITVDKSKTALEKNNEKIFWARGNGWVFAGLARIIDVIPTDDPERAKYLQLFQDMAYRLTQLQQADGLWRSHLNYPQRFPTAETSGSALFVFGLAKGVNQGWLPAPYFERSIIKGWSGLMSSISPEGRLTHVQLVAGEPTEVRAEDSADFATGGLLLAGAEVLKLRKTLRAANPKAGEINPRVITDDGAYTWYNDERAIFSGDTLYVSYMKLNGISAMSSFGLDKGTAAINAKHEILLSNWKQTDDHNNASLLALANGNIIATFAKHSTDGNFYQRTLTPKRWDAPEVSNESVHFKVTSRFGLTYQNLLQLKAENNRIYNFFRGIDFNPSFVYSDDDGKTWSQAYKVFASGENSSHRPYVKYATNDNDRIDFIFTDGHPRNSPHNNVYHLYLTAGVFYNSAGEKISTLEQIKTQPIDVAQGTKIFDGSTTNGRGWVWELEYTQEGEPHAGFISAPSGDMGSDMRYWSATLVHGKWQIEQIAYAGSNLYPEEEHYAGGITFAPFNENRAIISTDVNPETNEPLPNRIYQLFRGDKLAGKWHWQQLTFDPARNQLRPFLVRGKDDILIWMRGEYIWYGEFYTDIVMSQGINPVAY